MSERALLKNGPANGLGRAIGVIFPINMLDLAVRSQVKEQLVISDQKGFGVDMERQISGLRAPEKIFTEQASA